MNKEELIGKLHMIYAGDRNALEEMVGYYDGLTEVIEIVQQENKQLKGNLNKLKEFIAKEYYMYLPLEASTKSVTILIDKIQELEQGSDE